LRKDKTVSINIVETSPTLLLRWARFFTLAGWNWRIASVPFFHFLVTFPCGHSECGSHELLIRVIPHWSYALLQKEHDARFTVEEMYGALVPALFGSSLEDTYWQMGHGDGGGCYSVSTFGGLGLPELWKQAENG
jgi:hypothetical protein